MVLATRHPRAARWGSLLAAFGLLLGGACQSTAPNPDTTRAAMDPVDLVWPPPPATPRLQWESSFTLPQDLGLRLGFWKSASRVIFGGPDDRLVRPQGIAVRGETIYLTDPGRQRVLIYARATHQFSVLASTAAHPWQVPTSVASLADGTLFVADAIGAVYRIAPDLTTTERLEWPELRRPVAVAVDETRDRLYVVDAERHQILWGNLDGTYRGAIGRRGIKPGEFNFPTHLTVPPDGRIYVADAMNGRVQCFGSDGRPRSVFGRSGDGTGEFGKLKGVAVDSHGTIYVVDALHDVVQLFDRDGRFLMHFGRRGRRAGEFWLPNGIAIDEADRVYVADSYNRRVQIFAPVEVTP